MGYLSLRDCITDLEHHQQLIRIKEPLSPHLLIPAIQRRVYRAGGPALLFEHVTGTPFPMLGNLFGTVERTRFIFRDALQALRLFLAIKIDPEDVLKHPFRYSRALTVLKNLKPKAVRTGPILEGRTTIEQLPQQISWPMDGGGFITLPQVYTEHPDHPGYSHSNLGMYRIQLTGNKYTHDLIGMHYQTHRGIGIHHEAAQAKGQALPVAVFVGGPPAMSLAAVMPLPEGVPELYFAGALNRHRICMIPRSSGLPLHAHADFCIEGEVIPNQLMPEGPFGDHLGYYSLQHNYPVLRVKTVHHRNGAIWPFTTVGRPPQEDTSFGAFIHELTGPIIPKVLPGVRAVHAVDATGVHPLLLAIGSERYTPYQSTRHPQEILTQANAILGQGQLSLAKYLLITNYRDDPALNIHDIGAFLRHVLERSDWRRDLHFQTQTTIDTLDYSGTDINRGSKLIIAAAGPKHFELGTELPTGLKLPDGYDQPQLALPGILVLKAPAWSGLGHEEDQDIQNFCRYLGMHNQLKGFRLIVLVDDSEMSTRSLENFLWVTFTRSNPSHDLYGISPFIEKKHWGCEGPLVIDARIKPHHAPPLEEDPDIEKQVDALAARGGPLHGIM